MALEFISAEVTNEVLNRECVIGRSPFGDNVEFTFVGYDYARQKGVPNGREILRLKTSIGHPFFASQLFKAKIDITQKMVAPSGSFIQEFNEALKSDSLTKLTDAQFILKILKICHDKGNLIKITRNNFIGYRYDGTQGYMSVLNLDWSETPITDETKTAIANSFKALKQIVDENTSTNSNSVSPANNDLII